MENAFALVIFFFLSLVKMYRLDLEICSGRTR